MDPRLLRLVLLMAWAAVVVTLSLVNGPVDQSECAGMPVLDLELVIIGMVFHPSQLVPIVALGSKHVPLEPPRLEQTPVLDKPPALQL